MNEDLVRSSPAFDQIRSDITAILLTVPDLSSIEIDTLMTHAGMQAKSSWYIVAQLVPVERLRAAESPIYITDLDSIFCGISKLLCRFGTTSTTNLRVKPRVLLNLAEDIDCSTREKRDEVQLAVCRALEGLHPYSPNRVGAFHMVVSRPGRGMSSIYWCSTEADKLSLRLGASGDFPEKFSVFACGDGGLSAGRVVPGGEGGRHFFGMICAGEYDRLCENILRRIRFWQAEKINGVHQGAHETCILINSVIKVLGSEIMFLDPDRELFECYLDIADSLTYEKLEMNVSHFFDLLERQSGHLPENSSLSAKAVEHITGNYQDPELNVSALAELLGVSRAHLSRVFSADIGISAHEYLHRTRISAAKTLLLDGVDVEEAARRCGYYYRRGFADAFSRYENESHAAWVKRMLIGRI